MAYFPFFVDLSGKTCLIAGGGAVALRKARILKEYGPRILIAAPKFHPDFRRQSGFFLLERTFRPEDLTGADLVIAATDDREENLKISALCREKGIPVNVVDDKAACTFLFPAVIKDQGITVGITTSGASPHLAACLKERVEESLPKGLGHYAAALAHYRDQIKGVEPPAVRKAVFRELADRGMTGTEADRRLSSEIIDELIQEKLRELSENRSGNKVKNNE